MFGFNALKKEKKQAQRKERDNRKTLAKEIKSIKVLSPCEQDLLFRLHLCTNSFQWLDLRSEHRTHYDALINKGFIKEADKQYYCSTKPEYKE